MRPSGPGDSPRARAVIVAIVVAVLATGLFGAFAYVGDYARYRGFAPPTHAASVPFGQVKTSRFYSPALRQRRDYLVYEPPGYAAAVARGARFPVLYLLHPPSIGPESFVNIAALSVRMDELIARRLIRPFLVVMPAGRHDGLRRDSEWANTPSGRYESFVLDTVRAADRQLATVPSRGARALAGPSMGGYGAVNITLHNLRTFGLMQSWSGYFTQVPTASFTRASAASLRANSPASYVSSLRPQLRRLRTRAVFYEGRQDRIESIPKMFEFVGRFRRAGGRADVALYRGGHTWALWRAQMPRMLMWASREFRAGGSR